MAQQAKPILDARLVQPGPQRGIIPGDAVAAQYEIRVQILFCDPARSQDQIPMVLLWVKSRDEPDEKRILRQIQLCSD